MLNSIEWKHLSSIANSIHTKQILWYIYIYTVSILLIHAYCNNKCCKFPIAIIQNGKALPSK